MAPGMSLALALPRAVAPSGGPERAPRFEVSIATDFRVL